MLLTFLQLRKSVHLGIRLRKVGNDCCLIFLIYNWESRSTEQNLQSEIDVTERDNCFIICSKGIFIA